MFSSASQYAKKRLNQSGKIVKRTFIPDFGSCTSCSNELDFNFIFGYFF